MDKFYILISGPWDKEDIKNNHVEVFVKYTIEDVIDELFKIGVNLSKGQIRLMLRRIIKNPASRYTNEAKIHSMNRIFWIFRDPNILTGPLIYRQGRYIMEEMRRILKREERIDVLDRLLQK